MRPTLIAVGLTVLLAGGCGAPPPTNNAPWPVEVDRKYEQIQDGMTPEEVAAVLGSEGGVAAADAPTVEAMRNGAKEKGRTVDEVREWHLSKNGFLRVAFADKKVVSKSLFYR